MTDVLIVDDHQLLATAVGIALRAEDVAADLVVPTPLPHLLETLLRAAPTVVLLDLDLGEVGDSTPLIAPLTAAGVRVVLMTGAVHRPRIALALEQGAVAYRAKTEGIGRLVDTVLTATRRPGPHDATLRMELLEELRCARAEGARTRAPFERLTEREQETLRAMSFGLSAREIAETWVVSEATVRTHVRGVLTKLQVNSQLAAVATALRAGWFDHEPLPVSA